MDNELEGNISACLGVARAISHTFGPCGMDKLIVCMDTGAKQFIVSNDGATILRHLNIEHPAAKLFIELSRNQDVTVGDGTTSTVLLAAGLLQNALQLVQQGWHPTAIVEEYQKNLASTIEIIHSISMPLSEVMMRGIARTSIGSKVLGNYIEYFSELGVRAAEKEGDVRIVTRKGNSMLNSRLVRGVLLVLRDRLPYTISHTRLVSPRVLVTSVELREQLWNEASVKLKNYTKAVECATEDTNHIISQCQTIVNLGVQAVVALGPISPLVEQFFAHNTVFLIVVNDLEELSAASLCTGCEVVSNLQVCNKVGTAYSIEAISDADSDVILISGGNACTVELHAPSYELAQECKRSFEDMLRALRAAKVHPKVVGGGGSVTLEISHRIRSAFDGTPTNTDILRRFVAHAFANACEVIARQLALNAAAGEHIVEEAKQMHTKGVVWAGIDLHGRTRDMVNSEIENDIVLEPAIVAISSMTGAVDVAELLLRIDRNVIAPPRAALV